MGEDDESWEHDADDTVMKLPELALFGETAKSSSLNLILYCFTDLVVTF